MEDIHADNEELSFSQAHSINDQNHIVGNGGIAGTAYSANSVFYYDQGSFQTVANSYPPEFVYGMDINNEGKVLVNRASLISGSPTFSSFLWKRGQTILSFDANGRQFYSRAINDNNAIVGDIYLNPDPLAGNNLRGFIWRNGQLTSLSALEDEPNLTSRALNINNKSTVIVGYSDKRLQQPRGWIQRPVYWQKNASGQYEIRDILDSTSTNQGNANAVNNNKFVVGDVSLVNGSDRHAFLYDIPRNELIDLRTRANDMDSRVLEEATDINENCQILVSGRDAQGRSTSFRLDPVAAVSE